MSSHVRRHRAGGAAAGHHLEPVAVRFLQAVSQIRFGMDVVEEAGCLATTAQLNDQILSRSVQVNDEHIE